MLRQARTFWVLIAIFIVLCPLPSSGTGPSFLEIKIVPVATNEHGGVLFKTKSVANPSGGYSIVAKEAEFGWLCVNSNGYWQETVHTLLVPEGFAAEHQGRSSELEDLYSRALQDAEADFRRKIELHDLSPSLSELLDECGHGEWRELDPATGKGRATWSPSEVCLGGRCSNGRVDQTSVGGLVSDSSQGTLVDAAFFHRGLAIFENIDHFDLSSRGAIFDVKNRSCNQCVYDAMEISGISRIPAVEDGPND